jgi:hypothetical protein
VWALGLRAEWHNVLLNPNFTDNIIDIDTGEKLLLRRIIQPICEKNARACSGELNFDFW